MTPLLSAGQIINAMQDIRNREVRIIPDMARPKAYYIVKKRDRWVKRKTKA